MKSEPITTQEEYEAVASRLEELKDAAPGTGEARELKQLTRLIVAFESRRTAASPEQSGMT